MKDAACTLHKRVVGTNTKMMHTPSEASVYLRALRLYTQDITGLDLFVLPSFPALPAAAEALAGSNIAWGSQDIHPSDRGAHTGDVSGAMLSDLGCRYAMMGHFERRHNYGETNEWVAAKAAAAVRWKMVPILCVGETVQSSIAASFEVVRAQLDAVSAANLETAVIAYEPGWAIGVSAAAAGKEWIKEMHRHIRQHLSRHGPLADRIRIVYGGSVSLATAIDIFQQPYVDGIFVGRSALDPEQFSRIIHSVV